MSVTEERGYPFSIQEIKERITPILINNNVTRAVIFGSYAKGSATPKSDVDLIVSSGKTGFALIGLLCEVENALGGVYLDFYDYNELIPGGKAEKEIERYGISIL